jgi:hypothetical protein
MQDNCTLLQISQANYINNNSAPQQQNIFFNGYAPKLKKFEYNNFKISFYIEILNFIFSLGKNIYKIVSYKSYIGTSWLLGGSHV